MMDMPAAGVGSLDEMLAEDHFRARALTSEIHLNGHDGAIHVPGMSYKANGANAITQTPPALLDADTEEALRATGVDPDRIAVPRSAGVI